MNVDRFFLVGWKEKLKGFLRYPNCCDQTEVCGGEGLWTQDSVGSGMQQGTQSLTKSLGL